MKGIIFTEFLDMVEEKFSADMVDDIIDASDLSSGGAYTSVGTYPHEEIIQLVSNLSKATGLSVSDLVKAFGEHLFMRFRQLYPVFFTNDTDVFTFLESVESHIHVEVHKLYPDAQLPHFDIERPDSQTLLMTYHSAHPFATLAEGLIRGCLSSFGVEATIHSVDHSSGNGTHMEFHIRRA